MSVGDARDADDAASPVPHNHSNFDASTIMRVWHELGRLGTYAKKPDPQPVNLQREQTCHVHILFAKGGEFGVGPFCDSGGWSKSGLGSTTWGLTFMVKMIGTEIGPTKFSTATVRRFFRSTLPNSDYRSSSTFHRGKQKNKWGGGGGGGGPF